MNRPTKEGGRKEGRPKERTTIGQERATSSARFLISQNKKKWTEAGGGRSSRWTRVSSADPPAGTSVHAARSPGRPIARSAGGHLTSASIGTNETICGPISLAARRLCRLRKFETRTHSQESSVFSFRLPVHLVLYGEKTRVGDQRSRFQPSVRPSADCWTREAVGR